MKKKYSEPEIKKIDLKIEEAVLTNCKMPVFESTGPGGHECHLAGVPCNSIGS